jgi:hypothetical protein
MPENAQKKGIVEQENKEGGIQFGECERKGYLT